MTGAARRNTYRRVDAPHRRSRDHCGCGDHQDPNNSMWTLKTDLAGFYENPTDRQVVGGVIEVGSMWCTQQLSASRTPARVDFDPQHR